MLKKSQGKSNPQEIAQKIINGLPQNDFIDRVGLGRLLERINAVDFINGLVYYLLAKIFYTA